MSFDVSICDRKVLNYLIDSSAIAARISYYINHDIFLAIGHGILGAAYLSYKIMEILDKKFQILTF